MFLFCTVTQAPEISFDSKECERMPENKSHFFYFINIENPSNDNIIWGGKKIKFTACPKPRRHFNKPQKFFDEQN